MKNVRIIVKKMNKGMFNAECINVKLIRDKLEKVYVAYKLEKGVAVQLDTYRGVEVAVFTPDCITSDNIVYYLHGGGLVTGDRRTAAPYSSQLALETGCKVVSCSYRLAPEDPFPAGFDDSYKVYKHLVEENPNRKISLIGESGGAYLSLAVALRARDEKIQIPSSVIINSIIADMSGSVSRIDTHDEITVTVSGVHQLSEMYAPNQDRSISYISPINADYKGLPPLKIVYDKGELLAIDSKLVAEKAKEAGVLVYLTEYIGCFHGFTTAGSGIPESERELIATSKFIQDSFVQVIK